MAAFKEEALDEVRAYRLAVGEAVGGKFEIVADFGEERPVIG